MKNNTKETKTETKILNDNSSLLTLTYYGAEKVLRGYNVMGVAKAALESEVRYLSENLGRENIRVNAIAPGYVSSSINIQDTHQNAYFEYSLQKRIILPEEIAELACYVCSDISNGLVGQVLVYDAGRLLM